MKLTMIRYLTTLIALYLSVVSFASETPCLDPLACNFMEEGECFFTDENGEPCVTEGCTIQGACNYDPEADIYDGSCEFESCLGCTDAEACNYDETALYDDATCIYYVDCNGTCGGDWIEDACGNCYSSYSSVSISLDSVDDVLLFYESFDGFGDASFVADFDGLAMIEIAGAKGGDSQFAVGGLGAHFYDTITVHVGDYFELISGQRPSYSGEDGAGGGGGTFLYQNSVLVLAAAGGGGAGGYALTIPGELQDGINGTLAECGTNGQMSSGEYFLEDGYGGCGGMGGTAGISHRPGGGGAGVNSNGGTYSEEYGGGGYGAGGASAEDGFSGGNGENAHSNGGFGGGGGGSLGGGGGGGYSGGGGGTWSGYTDSDNGHGGGGGGSLRRTFSEGLVLEGNALNGILRIWNIGTSEPYCNPGCTYPQACNYDPESNFDDGSCDYCFCLEGTQWNDSLQGCVSTAPPLMDACGEGTYWDDEAQACLANVTCAEDLNGDGVIATIDLLQLLSSYGSFCEAADTSEWSCGDPMNYHGYDYATVQIGEQCWFAENLRTELYQNGDSILSNLFWTEWQANSENNQGATAVYGEGESPVNQGSSDEVENLNQYGRLYNYGAVNDLRGLCPTDWSAGTDEQWGELEMSIGLGAFYISVTGTRGSEQGYSLKVTESENWDGNNSSQFSARPGGYRNTDGQFRDGGDIAYFWSTFESSGQEFYRALYTGDGTIGRFDYYYQAGFSVRCLKDIE